MNSKLKVLLSVVAMSFMLVGCGSSGSSGGSSVPTPAIDNSGNLENQYGYFGDEVILGNTLVVGNWTNSAMYNGVQETALMNIYSDGEMTISNITNGLTFYTDYGISQDGTILRTALGDTVRIQSSIGNNCYSILMTNINQEGSLSAELCKQ